MLEKPERVSWPMWVGILTLGGLVLAGLAAVGVFFVFVVIAIGIAVAAVAGLVTVVRQILLERQGGEDLTEDQPSGEDLLMEVEEIVTISTRKPADPSAPRESGDDPPRD